MKNCLFCQIVAGKIPADFIYQGEEIVAFKDIKPKAPVHILVVPKKHLEKIQDAQKKDIVLLGRMIFRAKEIAKKLGLKDFKLAFNCGRGAGQVVPHVHLHLLGGGTEGRC